MEGKGKKVLGVRASTYLVVGGEEGLVYSVSETNQGSGHVLALRIDKTKREVEVLCKRESGGLDPCHLALEKKSGVLAVCNYSGGGVSLFRVEGKEGTLSAP